MDARLFAPPPTPLEEWMRQYYFKTFYDLGSSGVAPWSLDALAYTLQIDQAMLSTVPFEDTPTTGLPLLRQAIATYMDVDVARVMVTHGSTEALALIMAALIQEGDHVLVPHTGYAQLAQSVEREGGFWDVWPLDMVRDWPTWEASLGCLYTPKTRMLIANFPHNPTGITLAPATADVLVEWADYHKVWLLWDDAFGELVYDTPRLKPWRNAPHVVVLGTLSKAFGLPGLRIGWCVVPEEWISVLAQQRDYTTLHGNRWSETLAACVMHQSSQLLSITVAKARANRIRLANWLKIHTPWLSTEVPMAGVCAWLKVYGVDDTTALCQHLAEHEGVLLVPGACFGAPRYIRLGFGTRSDSFEHGLAALHRALAHGKGFA